MRTRFSIRRRRSIVLMVDRGAAPHTCPDPAASSLGAAEALPVAPNEGRLRERPEQRPLLAEPDRDPLVLAGVTHPVAVDEHRTADPGVRFQTWRSWPRGTTNGRARRSCGATNVSAIASRPHISTGPPFERLYAVEPDGVEQMRPSHGTRPKSSPPIDHLSSTMRPSTPLVTTASLTAMCRCPPVSTSSVASSTGLSSPANTRVTPCSSSSRGMALRKPTRP